MKAIKAAFVLAVGVLVSSSSVYLLAWGPTPTPRAFSAARFAASLVPTPAQNTPPQVYKPGNGVTYPVLLRQQQPVYTDGAQRARIEGVVVLEGVVQPDGTFGDLRIQRSLDRMYGLDENAMAAARTWLFKPGLREGKPVPVIVTLELEFRLYNPQPLPALSPRQTAPTVTLDDDFGKGAYRSDTTGLVMPILRKQVQPYYTPAAMQAKSQGLVVVEAVVMADGTVGQSRVVNSLYPDFGLDRAALVAANQWTFSPGTLNGVAVPVVVTLEIEFRLGKQE